jgi:hypothetical protein
VAFSIDSGTDHSGFPLTGGFVVFGFGTVSGLRLPTSTLSEGPAISFGRISRVAEVAAEAVVIPPAARIRPGSNTRPAISGHFIVFFLSAAGTNIVYKPNRTSAIINSSGDTPSSGSVFAGNYELYP